MNVVRVAQDRVGAMSLRGHVLLAIGSVVILGVVNAILNQSYEASNHPVSYAEGQTTFSGPEIKGFYAVMEAASTLDRYWVTQLIDFAFIAAMILLGISFGMLLSRLNRAGSIFARLGRAAATLIPLGAMFDVAENLISFILLSDAQGFPDWLAIPYSGAAVIKFVLIALGMLAAFGAAIGAVVEFLRTRGGSASPG